MLMCGLWIAEFSGLVLRFRIFCELCSCLICCEPVETVLILLELCRVMCACRYPIRVCVDLVRVVDSFSVFVNIVSEFV